MKVKLPHINYAVTVKKFTRPPEEIQNAKAYVIHDDDHNCTVYISGKQTPPDLAHELTHVLQFICLDRNINFCIEQEHMAYIMGYLMGKIMGYHYD